MKTIATLLATSAFAFSMAVSVSAQESAAASIDISAMSKKEGAAACRAAQMRPDFANGVCVAAGKPADAGSKGKRPEGKGKPADAGSKGADKRAAADARRELAKECREQGMRPDVRNGVCVPRGE